MSEAKIMPVPPWLGKVLINQGCIGLVAKQAVSGAADEGHLVTFFVVTFFLIDDVPWTVRC